MLQTPYYICPICSDALVLSGDNKPQSLTCENNHSFDVAKEGYVNLLPVQMKKSLQPGDDKGMVQARRAFLDTGHYEFLQTALIEKLRSRITKIQSTATPTQINLVDLGCGEGYYTNQIQTAFGPEQVSVYGADISKAAVKYAAKRNKSVHYAVATNAQLPFADGYIDVIANVFAPLIGKECARILNSTGTIISVAPGPKHLLELKSFIYNEAELHSEPKAPDSFCLDSSENIDKTIEIKTEVELSNLLTMTPFGWKTSEQTRVKMIESLPLNVTLDFVISEYIRNIDQAN